MFCYMKKKAPSFLFYVKLVNKFPFGKTVIPVPIRRLEIFAGSIINYNWLEFLGKDII